MYFTAADEDVIVYRVLEFLEFTTDIPDCYASKIYFYASDG